MPVIYPTHRGTPGRQQMQLSDFYNRFALEQDGRLSFCRHPDFTFQLNGWSAAVALAEDIPKPEPKEGEGSTEGAADREKGEDKYRKVCRMLLTRMIDPTKSVIETLVKWSKNWEYWQQDFSDWVIDDVREYWMEACRRQVRVNEVPQQYAFERPYNDAEGRARRLNVQYREPLALPYPPDENHYFQRTDANKHVPQSAIFFASRFHRLRELERRLLQVSKLEAIPSTRREKEQLLREVHSVLLSALLYFAAAWAHEDSSIPFGFNYDSWKEAYEHGTSYGGEIFGLKDGFGLNREFFYRYLADSDSWIKSAIETCSHELSLEARLERGLILEVSKEMVGILQKIFDQGDPRLRSPTPTPSSFHPESRLSDRLKLKRNQQLARRAEGAQRREARKRLRETKH